MVLGPDAELSGVAPGDRRVQDRVTRDGSLWQTVVCTAVSAPLDHKLPGEEEARRLAAEISAAGIAKPA